MTDINVFGCHSCRSVEREAVGLALMRQLVKAGKLKVAWMSEEERAASAAGSASSWGGPGPRFMTG